MIKPGESRGRVPPHSLEAEVSVLGAVLLSNDALNQAMEILRPEDFYDLRHRSIFDVMSNLSSDNRSVDVVTVAEGLKKGGQLDKMGGAAYLASLDAAVATAAGVADHARIVKNYSISRQLIERATDIVTDSFQTGADVDELLDRAERSIFEVAESRIRQDFSPLRQLVSESFKHIEHLVDNPGRVTGVTTGFIDLDNLLAGFQPSDLIIVAARPSMGKTALALNMALSAASRDQVGVGIFSLEMGREQLAMRLLCSEAKVPSERVRTGFISESDWPKLTDGAGALAEAPIWIDDTPGLDVLEMRAKARRLKKEHDVGLVVIDYLQLMQSRNKTERREQEISEISRSLKAMAKELKIPVIALSQLNRQVESRPNKRPMLADLRESGAIEQDADVILFIYRDEFYNRAEDNPLKGIAEIIVGKHRNGPTGEVKLRFNGRFTKFEDLDQRYDGYAPQPQPDAEAY